MEELGPVQIMVVGFEDPNFTGEVLSELRRLKDADLLRVVDLVVVAKDADGEVAAVEMSDLSDEERAQFGAVAGALIGLGMEGDEEGLEARFFEPEAIPWDELAFRSTYEALREFLGGPEGPPLGT